MTHAETVAAVRASLVLKPSKPRPDGVGGKPTTQRSIDS